MSIDFYVGDCLEIVSTLGLSKQVALITDPPYGNKQHRDYSRFSGGSSDKRNDHQDLVGDFGLFDPSPWVEYPYVVLWGYQYFAQHLPLGTTLVWVKKRDNQLDTVLSDAELAWQKGGKGVYVFRHIWNGFDRETERRQKILHPTQKPVALFEWVIRRLNLPQGTLILDPYCGSGPIAKAASNLGFDYIGIDIEPSYIEIAHHRMES